MAECGFAAGDGRIYRIASSSARERPRRAGQSAKEFNQIGRERRRTNFHDTLIFAQGAHENIERENQENTGD